MNNFRCYNCGNPIEKIATSCGCDKGKENLDIDIFTPTSSRLTIEFETVNDANEFKSWLCGQGEQYFFGMDEDTEEEHYSFFYHIKGGNTIRCFKNKKESHNV